MAQESRNRRKYRRTKLELSRAYRMLEMVVAQRNQARLIASALEQELKKRDERVEITRIPDETPTGTTDPVQNVQLQDPPVLDLQQTSEVDEAEGTA